MAKNKIGVVVMRAQTPWLHPGHKAVIDLAFVQTDKVYIFLGIAPQIDEKNPLPYQMRKQMLEASFGNNIQVLPIKDMPGEDALWVASLDTFIRLLTVADNSDVVIYGSRDSMINCYRKYDGSYTTQIVQAVGDHSATKLREDAANNIPAYNPTAALAVIWAVAQLTKAYAQNQSTTSGGRIQDQPSVPVSE